MKMMKQKTKLAGGHKKLLYFIFLILLFCNKSFCSQIYDYQTDKLIEKINSEILSVNNYNKKINFKIINDSFPNAFVTEDNTLFISSGLIVYSPDYVSLLAVLAHEIGHLEEYHVAKRINAVSDLKKINSFGNLVAIAGSMIIQEPELINAVIVNQTSINNLYINFSQDQEKEADIYAVNTLEKLNLSKRSLKQFLSIIESKTQFDLVDIELRKFSTHPLFKERYELLESQEEIGLKNFDQNLQTEFNYIKAKFIAYTNNEHSNVLNGDEKIYYEAIQHALSGKLFDSLKKLNSLISKYNYNYFFLETKADILQSYGYIKEAIEFYKKVLIQYPENNYVKFNIFLNSKYINKDKKHIKKIFIENQNLINLFPYNKDFITKYYNLAKYLEYADWISFFEILLFNKKELKKNLVELNKKTKDNNLKTIIKLYI